MIISSKLWLCVAGYINYISSRYVFISSFVSLTKYTGLKLNSMMLIRMAVEVILNRSTVMYLDYILFYWHP